MRMHDSGLSLVGAVGRLLALSAGLTALLWLGGDPRVALPAPGDVASVAVWRQWLAARESIDVLLALARAVLLALNVWLLSLMSVALLARTAGWVRPLVWLERLTPPIARGLIRSTLGLGVAVATLAPPATAGATGGTGSSGRALEAAAEDHDDAPLLRRLPAPTVVSPDDLPPASTSTAPREPAQEPAQEAARAELPPRSGPAPPGVPSGPPMWTVSPGDHFWSIAETVVSRTEPHVTERDVRRYWRQLIVTNRSRLVDPSNPDYILPGQQLQLPPIDV